MIELAAPPIDQLLGAVVLLEQLDALTAHIALQHDPLERARAYTERAWVLMRLRDRHPEGQDLWPVWDCLMNLDVDFAAHLAKQLEGR